MKLVNICKKILSTTALAATLATSFVSLDAQATSPRKFLVGIEDGYYPYEYLDESGKFTGYDVETLNAVCAKIGAQCELARGSFESLIPNLLFKKVDFVISALSITEERKKKVLFSNSYVPPMQAVYITAQDSPIKSIDQIKTVGVQQGTTLATYLKSLNKYKIVQYNSFDTEVLDIKAGRIDAGFEDLLVSSPFLNSERNAIRVVGEGVMSPLLSEGTGIAFRFEDKALVEEVNKALAELEADGTLPKLRQKYGLEVMAKAEPTKESNTETKKEEQ